MEGTLFTMMLVWSVLSLILFVKLWRMTNDVKALRDKFAPKATAKDKYSDVPTTWEEFDEGKVRQETKTM